MHFSVEEIICYSFLLLHQKSYNYRIPFFFIFYETDGTIYLVVFFILYYLIHYNMSTLRLSLS